MGRYIKLFLVISLVALIFTGCSDKRYTKNEVGSINTNYSGVVVSIKGVKLEGDGSGSLLGHLLGAVVGYQFGEGTGKMFSTYAGSIVGTIAGQKADFTNGIKVAVRLDSGKMVTTILKKDNKNATLKVGDRVDLMIAGNKVTEVIPKRDSLNKEPVDNPFDNPISNDVNITK